MAAIDKWYTSSYDEYTQFLNWAKDKKFYTPHKVEVHIYDYVYDYWTEDDFENGNKSRPVFNTPTCVDNYLYHNCPFEFIKDWLNDSYSGQGFCKGISEDITSVPTLPQFKVCTKVQIVKKGLGNHPVPNNWLIDVIGIDENKVFADDYYYNRDKDFWMNEYENDIWTSSCCSSSSSVKAIIRKILKKWKLPINCHVTITGRYIGDEWILLTK